MQVALYKREKCDCPLILTTTGSYFKPRRILWSLALGQPCMLQLQLEKQIFLKVKKAFSEGLEIQINNLFSTVWSQVFT